MQGVGKTRVGKVGSGFKGGHLVFTEFGFVCLNNRELTSIFIFSKYLETFFKFKKSNREELYETKS